MCGVTVLLYRALQTADMMSVCGISHSYSIVQSSGTGVLAHVKSLRVTVLCRVLVPVSWLM